MFSAFHTVVKTNKSLANIQNDVLAGLTVGVIALPLSMALAIAIGVPPQHGLYTALIAGIVIALAGGSRVNISGPTAAFVVVLLPIVQQYGIGGLLVSSFMAGIILFFMGIARFGRFIEVVPYPVVVGFTSGIGVVIATLQIKDFLGLDIQGLDGHYLDKLCLIIQSLPTINWQEALIGFTTLGILVVWPKLRSRIPGHLVALLVGSFAAWMLGQASGDFSVATIGSRFHYEINGILGAGVPPVLPGFEWPWNLPGADGQPIGFSFKLFHTLFASAVVIAILGALESLLCAVVADGMSGFKHNPNDELIGQGIGNMIAPLFGGIPATAAIARTAANIRAGGISPLSSVIHGLFILASILCLSPLLSYIPMASMAALLLMVAWNMSEVRHFIRTIKVAPKDDVITLLVCFLLTVIFDMTVAVGVGMGIAGFFFIRKSVTRTENLKVESGHDKDTPTEIAIYDINGPLFFGSTQKAMKNITAVTPDVRVVILDMSEVTMIDMSAIVSMESIVENLSINKVGLVINNLQPKMIVKLRRAGIDSTAGAIYFSKTMDEALTMANKHLLEAGNLKTADTAYPLSL